MASTGFMHAARHAGMPLLSRLSTKHTTIVYNAILQLRSVVRLTKALPAALLPHVSYDQRKSAPNHVKIRLATTPMMPRPMSG